MIDIIISNKLTMNSYEYANSLLKLCPITSCIRRLIIHILVGYGTPSTNAIKNGLVDDDQFPPIKIVVFASLDKCSHTLYFKPIATTMQVILVVRRCMRFNSYICLPKNKPDTLLQGCI